MRFETRGAWAVVTGASSGIGLAIARELGARGMNLALVARRGDELAKLAAELGAAHGVETLVHAADLSAAGAAEGLAAALAGRGIVPAVLVNNAGYGIHGEFDAIEAAHDEGMIDLNVKALARLTRALVPGMKRRGSGRVLFVASIGSFMPSPSYATYCATKAFVQSYGLAVREELRGSGVVAGVVYPGVTETAFHTVAGQPTAANAFKRMTAMSAEAVAKSSVRGMLAGRAEIVPGFVNRLFAFQTRFLPRPFLAALSARLMR